MNVLRTLYKRDSKGLVREWRMEVEGDKFRTIAGLQEGEQVTSTWRTAKPKNIGRANETSAEDQAMTEAEAKYTKKLRIDYSETIGEIDTAQVYLPMLAQSWAKRKDKINYKKRTWAQPKLDGIRCIAMKRGLFTRTGTPIVSAPHIREALVPHFERVPESILDGELYNHDLWDDFNSIVSMVRKTVDLTEENFALSKRLVQYHMYDNPGMPELNFDVRYGALIEQMKHSHITDLTSSPIKLVETVEISSEQEIDDWFEGCVNRYYEGAIIRLEGAYQQKRSNNLIKRKVYEDEEFELLRIEEGEGNWSKMAKRIVFRNDQGERTEVGAGLKGTREFATELLANAANYIGKDVTIQFNGRTPAKKPKNPVAIKFHLQDRW